MQSTSSHYSIDDLLRSDIAGADDQLSELQRRPSADVLAALETLRRESLEPLCDILGYRPRITSGYRSPRLNERVGGRPDSPHIHGLAVDLVLDDVFFEDQATERVRRTIEAAVRKHGGDCKDTNANFYLFVATLLHAESLRLREIIHEHGSAGRPAWVHVTMGPGPAKIYAIGDYSDGGVLSLDEALALGTFATENTEGRRKS